MNKKDNVMIVLFVQDFVALGLNVAHNEAELLIVDCAFVCEISIRRKHGCGHRYPQSVRRR